MGLLLSWLGACTGDSPVASSTSSGGSGDAPDATVSSSGGGEASSSSGASGDGGSSSSSGQPADGGELDAADADDGGLASIPGLVMWLEGDGLTQGPVTTWTDRSGKGNSAIAPESGSPAVATNSADGINGHPAVHFQDAKYLVVPDDPTIQFDGSGFLIAIVERHPAFGAPMIVDFPGVILDKASNGSPFEGINLQLMYADAAGNPAYLYTQVENGRSVSTPTTAPGIVPGSHLLMARLDEQVLSVAVDTGAPVTSAVGVLNEDFGNIGSDLRIGRSDGAFSAPFTGDIAAVVMVKAATDADVARVSAYLRQRYGL